MAIVGPAAEIEAALQGRPLPEFALSIRQPWAWAILACGKDVENRSWRTRFRGPVLIHAGQTLDVLEFTCATLADRRLLRAVDAVGGTPVEELRRQVGGIVGVVDIVDCVPTHASPWFAGPWGFVLANPRPLPFVACPGQLGFFRPFAATGPLISRVELPNLFTSQPIEDFTP